MYKKFSQRLGGLKGFGVSPDTFGEVYVCLVLPLTYVHEYKQAC